MRWYLYISLAFLSYLFVILVPIDWFVIMLYLSLCLVGDFQRFIETMRGIQGALIVAAGFQMLMGFLGIWRNAVRYCYPCLKVFSVALPLVESINSELNLKEIFQYGVFGMPIITNKWQVLVLVRILFQWELDESRSAYKSSFYCYVRSYFMYCLT